MDIKSKNNSKGFLKFLVGGIRRQTVVIIAMTAFAVFFMVDLLRFNNIANINIGKDFERNMYDASVYTSYHIYEETKNLEDIKSGKISKVDMLNIVPDPSVKVAIVNKETGNVYTNDKNFMAGKLSIEDYIAKRKYKFYYECDNVNTFSPYIMNNENPSKYKNSKTLSAFKEYYWADIDGFKAIGFYKLMIRAWRSLIFIIVWALLLIVYLYNCYKAGKEEVKREIGNLFLIRILRGIKNVFSLSGMGKKAFFTMVISIILGLYLGLGGLYWLGDLYNLYYDFNMYQITFLCIIAAYLIFIFIPAFKKASYFNHILKGTKNIASGDFNYELKEKGDKDLKKLAHNINIIKDGFKVAVDEKVKNERLKSELVTNVSHDLKTPLTSIINYIDILQREDVTEEEKKDYIKILDQKSHRLKFLIEDLFEISKMNSGKIELERSNIDIVELMHQCLGELSGYYSEKNIAFKVSSFEEKVMMNVDGKKMARVFENMISNALKYSMENTRVYIDIAEEKENISISFKNVSAYEMNFNAEELCERFKRGDESRTSTVEGSGLGLAIAKSIVGLHGGTLKIETEGDLFKVFILLKRDM